MNQHNLRSLSLGFIVPVCTLIIVGGVLAWSNPILPPPGGNIPAPLNISSTTQTKIGSLNILGSVGIGTSSPSQKLSVSGVIESLSGGFKFPDSTIQTSAANIPAGSVMFYASSTAPSGWLLCNGQAVSRTIYSGLFGVIGTVYGAGDGSTTFNVPDMRGRNPIGYGQGTGLTNRLMAATSGEETHLQTINEMPAHTHTGPATKLGASAGSGSGWESTGSVTTGSRGGGQAFNVMDPFLVVNCIIKY